LQIKTKIVSSHTADSKPVKQEVNGTVILPPLVFPDSSVTLTVLPRAKLTPSSKPARRARPTASSAPRPSSTA
jgi:hypothetical protein